MNNIKKYIILCSISSVVTTVLSILSLENIYLIVINIILSLAFFISCKKFKLKKFSLLVPSLYLIFLTSMIALSITMNSSVIIEYIHIVYYMSLVLFANIMLNIYSLLCIYKK